MEENKGHLEAGLTPDHIQNQPENAQEQAKGLETDHSLDHNAIDIAPKQENPSNFGESPDLTALVPDQVPAEMGNEEKVQNLNNYLQSVEETTNDLTGDHPGDEYLSMAEKIQEGALDFGKNSDNAIK